MEELLIDCCLEFLKLIEKLKNEGKITKEEYDDMAKLKNEFVLKHGFTSE